MNSDIPLIIFVLLPERTAFNASFTLARRLVEAGYRVSYIGPRVYQGHVTAQGFAYVILFPDPLLPDPSSEDPKSRLVRWWRRWREINQGFQNDQDDLFASMPAMEDWLRHNSPCLALLDPLMWEFAPPFLKRRVPIVGICSTLTAKFDINIPPVFSESIPEGEIGT